MISLFPSVYKTEPARHISIDEYFDGVKSGKWVNDIIDYRRALKEFNNRRLSEKWSSEMLKSETEKLRKIKNAVPNLTISGKFTKCDDNSLLQHSGYICIDIDDLQESELLNTKTMLAGDPYIAACLLSISGTGFAVVFKIDPKKHNVSYNAISAYLNKEYGLITDPSCKNVSRRRFVSHDPEIYINTDAELWTKFVKDKKYISRTVFTNSDFAEILNRVQQHTVDITGDYHQWLGICFGLVDQFGEAGRSYFHTLSQYSSSYNYEKADRQYDACLRSQQRGGGSTRCHIGTVYHYLKQNGISTQSQKTIEYSKRAAVHKKSGLTKKAAKDTAAKFGNFDDDIDQIYDQVFDTDVKVDLNNNIIETVIEYLYTSYDIRFNEITRRIEIDGKELDDIEGNSLFLRTKKIFDKLNRQLFDTIIMSDSTKKYNPLTNWLESNTEIETGEYVIRDFFSTIKTDAKTDPAYIEYFGTKWLCGVISAMHGEHSPLMLVLSGIVQGTGKTEFFRRMLPKGLKKYYSESKLDAGKDDEILMTQKLIIMDDELGGKSKKESKRLKELTSKDTFTLRAPYGRYNEDLKRLAVLCGTTNHTDILQDPTGNRRIIPINVISIDHDKYNSIDKKKLFIAAYKLYKSGYNWRVLKEDINKLRDQCQQFEAVNMESELISSCLTPDPCGYKFLWTNSEIKSHIETLTHQRLSSVKIGIVMKDLGFVSKRVKRGGGMPKVYEVYKIGDRTKEESVFDLHESDTPEAWNV